MGCASSRAKAAGPPGPRADATRAPARLATPAHSPVERTVLFGQGRRLTTNSR